MAAAHTIIVRSEPHQRGGRSSRNRGPKRLPGIDQLRILAASAIIWFHIPGIPCKEYGFLGVPIFLMIGCVLLARQPQIDLKAFLQLKATRLLAPWLFWSGVYLLLIAIRYYFLGPSPKTTLHISMLLYGTCDHLWYLPYAFTAFLLGYLLLRATARLKPNRRIWIFLAGGLILLLITAAAMDWTHGFPYCAWVSGLPSLPLGLLMGQFLDHPGIFRFRRRFFFRVSIPATISLLALIFWLSPYWCMLYLAAVGLVVCGFIWPGIPNPRISSLAGLTYGMYLCHPMTYSMLKYAPLGFTRLGAVEQAFIVIIGSALLAWLIRKTPARRFI